MNISPKLLELETSNLIHGFVWGMPSRRTNKTIRHYRLLADRRCISSWDDLASLKAPAHYLGDGETFICLLLSTSFVTIQGFVMLWILLCTRVEKVLCHRVCCYSLGWKTVRFRHQSGSRCHRLCSAYLPQSLAFCTSACQRHSVMSCQTLWNRQSSLADVLPRTLGLWPTVTSKAHDTRPKFSIQVSGTRILYQ